MFDTILNTKLETYLSSPHPSAVAGKPFSLIANLCATNDTDPHPLQLLISEVITCTAPAVLVSINSQLSITSTAGSDYKVHIL